MNERDMRLLDRMKGAIDGMDGGIVLLDVDTTRFVCTNIVMLSALLESRGGKGLFISVDRPHQYMVHLMTMHGLDPDRLIFIDAISRFAADSKKANVNVGYLNGPFNIDTLPSMFDKGSQTDLSDVTFALIDNLAVLLTYNPYPRVERFLMSVSERLVDGREILFPIMVDSKRNALLYETVRYLSTEELDPAVPISCPGGG